MKITNDPILAYQSFVGDIEISATGAEHPHLRSITLTQPLHAEGSDDDTIWIDIEYLDEFIKELKLIQEAYSK